MIVRIRIPDCLLGSLKAQAELHGLTPNQLAVSLLSAPLDKVGTVHWIKCPVCGRPWVDHRHDCPRHDHRPGWSRIVS